MSRLEPINLGSAERFVKACESLGVSAPRSVATGIAQIAVAKAAVEERAAADVLSMNPDEISAFIIDRSIRKHRSTGVDADGLAPGLERFQEAVIREVRTAALPDLETLTDELRPIFEERSAPLVTAAQRYGFTLATTPEDVLNLADESASSAWREYRQTSRLLDPVVNLRRELSTVFHVSPTRATIERELEPFSSFSVNYSVCFAAADNWSLTDGFVTNEDRSNIDWLALAVGGLRLNSPVEVEAKINDRQKQERQAAAAEKAAEARAVEEEAQRELTRLERSMGLTSRR